MIDGAESGAIGGVIGGLAVGDLLTGLALVAVFEGLLYAAFPGVVRKGVETVSRLPDAALRLGGLAMLASGVFAVWLVRG